MDNIENNNVIQEQFEQQNDEIQFNYGDTTESKPNFELKKGDMIFAGLALFGGIFLSMFGIFGGFSLGYLMSLVLIVTIFAAYLIKKDGIRLFPILCGLLTLGNAAVFITTTNSGVKFFAVIISFLLLLVSFNGFIGEKAVGNRGTVGVFFSAASTIGNIVLSIRSIFSKKKDGNQSFGKVMLGFACAIPVLIIVVPLLLKSDAAFSGMIDNIFGNMGDLSSIIFKSVFGANLAIPIIAYGFSLKNKRFAKLKESKFQGIENIFIISFLSAIAVCYLLYLFSQLAYFFSAFNGFLPNGNITYAQYARKGFFEMCAIAVINLTLVMASMLLSKKQEGKVCLGVKLLSTFIAVFTLIIIATAVSKMVLYINNYGMTVRRVTTSAFMMFLAVVFIALILRIYINKINVVKVGLLTAGVVVIILGTANVNAVCAKYNYDAYKSQELKVIDINAMYDLGDEGIPYVVKLACSKDREVAIEAQQYLKKAYKQDYFYNTHNIKNFTVEDFKQNSKNKGFEEFNIPQKRAYDYLYAFIEKNPTFCSKIDIETYSYN